jgi:hypothetical protein
MRFILFIKLFIFIINKKNSINFLSKVKLY